MARHFLRGGGLKVGTHECSGVELPTLTNPANSETDVAFGKEYINEDGEIEVGNLNLDMIYSCTDQATFPIDHSIPWLHITESLGDATPADVAAGKTFTTDEGVQVGTGEMVSTELVNISYYMGVSSSNWACYYHNGETMVAITPSGSTFNITALKGSYVITNTIGDYLGDCENLEQILRHTFTVSSKTVLIYVFKVI